MTGILRIVSGVSGSTILDLNDYTAPGGVKLGRAIDLASPSLQQDLQAGARWSDAGPAVVGGPRQITIPLVVIGSSADDLGTRIAALNTAVRSPWWLQVRRHGASNDAFLQCYPAVPQMEARVAASSLPHVAVGKLVAATEPYALGARVDVGPQAVPFDPSSLYSWVMDVSVAGDALTPALLRWNDSTALANPVGIHVSVRRRGGDKSPLTAPALTTQAETALTANGTNVTCSTVTGDSTLSGGSGVRVTFGSGYVGGAPPSDVAVLTLNGPSLSGVTVPGTYRVLIRLRRSGSTAGKRVILRPFFLPDHNAPQYITLPATGSDLRVVDLGLVQWPSAQVPRVEAPVPNDSGATTSPLILQMSKPDSGGGVVDVDWVAWLPADEDTCTIYQQAGMSAPSTQWLIGDAWSQQALVTSADPVSAHNVVGVPWGTDRVPYVVGGLPMLSPGANRLFIVAGLNGLEQWPIGQSLNTRLSYWPRYTWLR